MNDFPPQDPKAPNFPLSARKGRGSLSLEGEEETTGPFFRVLKREPLLAEKDGYLVLVVDEVLEDMPNWVEWDPDRNIISITHMGGGILEARLYIPPAYLDNLRRKRKLLLVSNKAEQGDEKIMHYTPFLAK
ncbi:MAG: hypothetical protein L6Q57_04225 [Alphaproteobacteria bacterium]|nr:hypothetical protein [Alphaproteobacteria bacterium]